MFLIYFFLSSLYQSNQKSIKMGVDTKIRIPYSHANKDINKIVSEIVSVIFKSFKTIGEAEVVFYHYPKEEQYKNYFLLKINFTIDKPAKQFTSGKEERGITVYYDLYRPAEDIFLYISFGAWGSNIQIAKAIVNAFGGFADFNDCDDILIDYAKPQPKK